jgi:hypothetical protein
VEPATADHPSQHEVALRDQVVERILQFVRDGVTIKLPPFDPAKAGEPAEFALFAIEPNEFSGTVGKYRYQFEGEDDLLHLMVLRQDRLPLTVEEAQRVVSFLLPEVPPALIWLRPGEFSQHFYLGHDELLR